MMRTTMTAALGLTLLLAGCSTAEEPTPTGAADAPAQTAAGGTTTDGGGATEGGTAGDGGTATGAAGAPMSDPVCAEFFQTRGVPLAERAEKDRTMLENGEVSDPATFGEVDLLSQRIDRLLEGASGEQATLLERINAPFDEASDAIREDPEVSATDTEIELPEIDVTDSAAAQEELLSTCSG